MEQSMFEAMQRCDDDYKKLTIDELEAMVEKGRKIVEKHGEENLQNILEEEEDFSVAGAFFTFRMLTQLEDDEQ